MYKLKDIPIHPDYHKYPSSDGEPMAETTLHFRWIVKIKENLETLTQGKDIFVAADLLWYPEKGRVKICKAPDVMVAFGRPKGDRLSYLQWHEGNVAPQVVFEIFSQSNRRRANKENLYDFYLKYGVEEYYIFDPEKNTFIIYLRQDDHFTKLEDLPQWVSPRLNIRFEWSANHLTIRHPDGNPFIDFEELERRNRYLAMQYEEVAALREQERKRLLEVEKEADSAKVEAKEAILRAKLEAQRAESEAQRAESEAQRAESEAQRAESEALKAKEALERQKLLEQKLKDLGIDPSKI